MLYVFDVDGTLIKGFLGDEECETCKGEGRLRNPNFKPFSSRALEDTWLKCPRCNGKGRTGGEHLPYEQVTPLVPALRGIQFLAQQPNAHFALATNQGGVAMGYQTVDQVVQKMGRVIAEFGFFHTRAFSVHVAMHHPDARKAGWNDPGKCKLRKPLPGMLQAAMRAHNKTARDTTFIGDMPVDRDCAEAAGVRFVWAKDFWPQQLDKERETASFGADRWWE